MQGTTCPGGGSWLATKATSALHHSRTQSSVTVECTHWCCAAPNTKRANYALELLTYELQQSRVAAVAHTKASTSLLRTV
jgi:hypothetical protein